MKPNYHKILSTAVLDGFDIGWSYAYEYTDSPSKETIRQAVMDHILSELYEWFDVEEDEND